MKTPEQELEPVAEPIEAPEPEEIAQPSERQGGEIDQAAILAQVDTYLHRLFQVGEIFPWKGVVFQVIGIRGGIVGLAVKTIRTPPKAKSNKGKRPSRRGKRNQVKRVAEHPAIQEPVETFEAKNE